jgi:TolA-binding protein
MIGPVELKASGNALFKEQDYEGAKAVYIRALQVRPTSLKSSVKEPNIS